MLRVTDQFRQLAREPARDMRRIGQPLVFIWLEPSEAIADDDPASHIRAVVAAGAVERGTQKDDRIAGFGFRDDHRTFAGVGQSSPSMASGPEQRGPIFLSERRQRPHGIDQIFALSDVPSPHVLVAVG